MTLTDSQRAELAAILEAFTAPLSDADTEQLVQEFAAGADEARRRDIVDFCRRSAADVQLPARFERVLFDRRCVSEKDSGDICLVLDLLSKPVTALLLTGRLQRFSDLSVEARVGVLQGWSSSLLEFKRSLFKVFKLVALRCYLSFTDGSGTARSNPSWSALGYCGCDPERDGPKFQSQQARLFDFTMLTADELNAGLSFDAVVVGSGCGGGVAAAELAAAGLRVLVVEKARYVHQRDFSLYEEDAFASFYENKGLLATTDTGVGVLAGSAFGGGSTVNWACSLPTPHHVRREWAELGLPAFLTPRFESSLEAVCARVNVRDDDVAHNAQNDILLRGARRLGFAVKTAGQNVRKADGSQHQCGWCYAGCRYGEKQGTQVTYLRDAAEHGAKFIDCCKVMRVTTTAASSSGKPTVTGIEAVYRRDDGSAPQRVVVAARLVVVACGALQTPLLLKRSGLRNTWIGRNLRLHPVTAVTGVFDERVQPWRGAIMTSVCTEPEIGPLGDYYGAKLETPSIHPGLMACAAPWRDPLQFKRTMLRFPHMSTVIVLSRDAGSGSVDEQVDGAPLVDYRLSPKNHRALLAGLHQACQILIAAGARSLMVGVVGVPEFVVGDAQLGVADPRFAAWWQQVESARASLMPLFSAHQMGTARMSSSPDRGAVDPDGQCWEVDSLYVCDTSTFPTPSGANPMITCFAIAHMIARSIIEKHKPIARL